MERTCWSTIRNAVRSDSLRRRTISQLGIPTLRDEISQQVVKGVYGEAADEDISPR
ncbi:MAG: hypothetical protein IPJ13_32595 [Saprospiraceae bacterium]|nr:hypothetical protein [Saprospiraceae bacterium]